MARRNSGSENISYSDDDESNSDTLRKHRAFGSKNPKVLRMSLMDAPKERFKSGSEGSSPKSPRKSSMPDSKSSKSLDLLHHLQAAIAEKDEKIEYLEKTIKEKEVLQY